MTSTVYRMVVHIVHMGISPNTLLMFYLICSAIDVMIIYEKNFNLSATAPEMIVAAVATNIAWKTK